jgi:hypothetical protein
MFAITPRADIPPKPPAITAKPLGGDDVELPEPLPRFCAPSRRSGQPITSGLPQSTDIVGIRRPVRKVPMGDITVRFDNRFAYDLLDDSVSPREKRGWDLNVNCLSRFSVDKQLKSSWLLDW